MRIDYTRTALEALEDAPPLIRRIFWGKMRLLEQNLLHPGLHVKKYNEAEDKWQGRVNREWRFYFRIIAGTIIITDVTPHPK